MAKYRQLVKKYLSIGVAVLIITAIFYFLTGQDIKFASAAEGYPKIHQQTMVLILKLENGQVILEKASKLNRSFDEIEAGNISPDSGDIKYEVISDQNTAIYTGIVSDPTRLYFDYNANEENMAEGGDVINSGGSLIQNSVVFIIKAPYDANAKSIKLKKYTSSSASQFLSEQSLGNIDLSGLKTVNQINPHNFGLNVPNFTVTEILNNGPSSKKIDLVLMGDGYTANEINPTSNDEHSYYNHVNILKNNFLAEEPFNRYQNLFNIWRVDVISNESGADHLLKDIYKDTFLGANYGLDGNLDVDETIVYEVADLIIQAGGDFDAIVVLVNDEQYGGLTGNVATYSAPWSEKDIFGIKHYRLEEAAYGIALHEIGHLVGRLGDEYTTDYPIWWPEAYIRRFKDQNGLTKTEYIGPDDKNYPRLAAEVNATAYDLAELSNEAPYKWSNWLGYQWGEIDRELGWWVDHGAVSCYEGSQYVNYGLYRPTSVSKMNFSIFTGYGPVNREMIIKHLFMHDTYDANLIQSFSPDPNAGTYTIQDSFTIIKQNIDTIGIEWLLDGVKLTNKTNWTFDFSGVIVSYGSHTLTAKVTDNSDWIRDFNKNQWAQEQISWSVEKKMPVPANLQAVYLNGKINLSWDAVSGATGYNVYKNNAWFWYFNANSAVDDKIVLGQTYTYQVDAYDNAGHVSAKSASVSITIPIPSIVLSAAAVSPTQVNLSWTSYPNASTYQIYRNNSWFSWRPAGTLTFSDTKCNPNTIYVYRVDVYDSSSRLLIQSNTVSVTTPSAPVIPPIPTGLTSVAGFDNIKWTWNASANVSYYTYKIYDGASCADYNQGGTVYSASYRLAGLPRCETYSFKVKACNSLNQCSGYTGCVSGRTLGCFY